MSLHLKIRNKNLFNTLTFFGSVIKILKLPTFKKDPIALSNQSVFMQAIVLILSKMHSSNINIEHTVTKNITHIFF